MASRADSENTVQRRTGKNISRRSGERTTTNGAYGVAIRRRLIIVIRYAVECIASISRIVSKYGGEDVCDVARYFCQRGRGTAYVMSANRHSLKIFDRYSIDIE